MSEIAILTWKYINIVWLRAKENENVLCLYFMYSEE